MLNCLFIFLPLFFFSFSFSLMVVVEMVGVVGQCGAGPPTLSYHRHIGWRGDF